MVLQARPDLPVLQAMVEQARKARLETPVRPVELARLARPVQLEAPA